MARATELSWLLDGIVMSGTLTGPEGDGPFPGVVMVAGSGPTDRNWNSPLLKGENGSGRLLAEALAGAGVVSLRYDKRASGPHVAENIPALIGRISMRSHLDELVAAVGALAGQDFVDPSRLVGLGNSEGCLHVLHYATSDQEAPLAGLVLTSPPGRAIGDLVLSQLALQFEQVPDGGELYPLVEAAAERYSAGQAMDLDPSLPEAVRMVLAAFEVPANLPFARELWSEDATDTLSAVRVPTLVLIGRKDIQVDAQVDGARLREAARDLGNVTFAFPVHANHVLKEEARTIPEVLASGDTRYSDPETHLDHEALGLLTAWLEGILASA